MNAYTLAARETVQEIRESLSRVKPTLFSLEAQYMSAAAKAQMCGGDYEIGELWARLAADIAAMHTSIKKRDMVRV